MQDYKERFKTASMHVPQPKDFAIGLVDSVLNLHTKLFGEFKLQKNCNQCSSKLFWASTYHISYNLPEWQSDFLCTPIPLFSVLTWRHQNSNEEIIDSSEFLFLWGVTAAKHPYLKRVWVLKGSPFCNRGHLKTEYSRTSMNSHLFWQTVHTLTPV